jgi:hypothetical protein
MIKKITLTICASSVFLLASDAMNEQDINKSHSVAVAMKKGLGGLLKQKLEKEGPVAAFGFCSDAAMPTTKKIADENNATVKRVTNKTRNPNNAPDAMDSKALAEFEKYKTEAAAPKYLVLKDEKSGVVKYYEPMYVMGMCLACHGDLAKMPEAVKAGLAAKYPHDKAIRYKVGDFRGLIAVELKK